MLKVIPPLLGPEILHIIASMGHGDEIVIADNNFPAASLARRLVRLEGANTSQTLEAILTLFPLDQYVTSPAAVMATVNEDDQTPDTYADFQRILEQTEERLIQTEYIERFDFYDRARNAFAIVITGDHRLYGNIIIKKGVLESPV